MKACDNRAPIEIRNKGKWIDVERLRWARQFGIPMSQKFPDGFPKPTLHLQRFLVALWMSERDAGVDGTGQETLTKALDALYESLWTDPCESNLVDPKVFANVLTPVLGEDVVKKHVEKMGSAEVKKQLIANTDQALGEGAFGLPWYQCVNDKGQVEGFWGFDHMGQVVRFLGLDGEGKMGGEMGQVRALL